MSISASRLLGIAVAIVVTFMVAAFGGAAAHAQCTCVNTIMLDPGLTCCILLSDIQIECDDHSINPAFPGAGPLDELCAGDVRDFPCPCPNFATDLIVAGTHLRAGGTLDILYGGCCMHFAISGTSGGCMQIIVTPSLLCSLDRTKPHPMGSLMQVWPYARG